MRHMLDAKQSLVRSTQQGFWGHAVELSIAPASIKTRESYDTTDFLSDTLHVTCV